jgi:phage gpG-like protein
MKPRKTFRNKLNNKNESVKETNKLIENISQVMKKQMEKAIKEENREK